MDGIDEFNNLQTLATKYTAVNNAISNFNTAVGNLGIEIAEFEALEGYTDLVEQTKKDTIAEYKLKLEALENGVQP